MLTVFKTLNTRNALKAERFVEDPVDAALIIIVIHLLKIIFLKFL